MATKVNLPEPVKAETGEWEYPDGWSEEDIRDWLVTHPEGVETITIADDPPPWERDDAPTDKHGGSSGAITTELDPNEYAQTDEKKLPAAAICIPPDRANEINIENYNPEEFILVHFDTWDEFMKGLGEGGVAQEELSELAKLHRAHMRGMRKVNRHWSDTKQELRKEKLLHTRTARKLRKARAGRDRRDRQVAQLSELVNTQARTIEGLNTYISYLDQER